jgi:5-methylcytosine-specific restriction protein A
MLTYDDYFRHGPDHVSMTLANSAERVFGAARSGHWPVVRRDFLAGKDCAACGGKTKLEAHHIVPFHVHPEKELDVTNLIPLCEGLDWFNCHLAIGHLGSFQSYNLNVVRDAAAWRKKLETRPTPKETRSA